MGRKDPALVVKMILPVLARQALDLVVVDRLVDDGQIRGAARREEPTATAARDGGQRQAIDVVTLRLERPPASSGPLPTWPVICV